MEEKQMKTLGGYEIVDEKAREEINIVAEKADEAYSLAKGATKAFVYDTYSDMISELNALDKAELLVNFHVMIREVCVPDLWISGVSNEHVEYTYTSNEDFIVDLTEDGVVQVGHFVLSALETQKVDLSEYVKNTEYASKNVAGVLKVTDYSSGLVMSQGSLMVSHATIKNIDDKTELKKPITPLNLDYAVKKALSDCKLTDVYAWTEEEKLLARELLDVKTSEYPKKVFEYEWKDNYDQIDVTSIDYETGILTVSSMPTQITDDVSTTVRVFPSLKIEGIVSPFKYGMMPKEIMETHSFYYAKKVGDNHVILCNPTNSTELTSITSSDVVDLTRWNLFVEKKRNTVIPNVEVKNLDKTHSYKLKYYLPQNAHYVSGIKIHSENENVYGKEYGFGYQSVDVHLNETNNNSSMFILNSYETVSVRSKNYAYNEHIVTRYPRFFEVDICKLSDEVCKADVNIGYFAPFGTCNDNTVLCMSTVKQNIFLQRPFVKVSFISGNDNYILDGARCEVWDYGEVL